MVISLNLSYCVRSGKLTIVTATMTTTTDYGLRTTDYGLRTTDYGLRTTDYVISCFFMISILFVYYIFNENFNFEYIAVVSTIVTYYNFNIISLLDVT